jgi:hypothetical protein
VRRTRLSCGTPLARAGATARKHDGMGGCDGVLGATREELVATALRIMRKTHVGIAIRRGVFEIALDGSCIVRDRARRDD